MPIPGVVSSLLTHGDVERERTPRRARRMSEEEPEPTPGPHRDEDEDDENPGDESGPGGDDDAKRKKATQRKTKEKQSKSSSAAAQSSQHAGATTHSTGQPSAMTQDEVDRPVEVPVPEDLDDNDMYIDDVLLTEVADLPDGWTLVDDHMELADAWVVQNLTEE